MSRIFNSLLKVVLNIEGDITKDNLAFKPKMLFSNNQTTDETLNKNGLLFSSKIDMKNAVSYKYQVLRRDEDNCNEYAYTVSEKIKKLLMKKWEGKIDRDLKEMLGPFSANEREKEDTITNNIKFLHCLFFQKYVFLTNIDGSDRIYTILNKNLTGTVEEPANQFINGVEYEKVYTVSLTLSVLDVFKPAYLRLTIEPDRLKKQVLFLPSMNEEEDIADITPTTNDEDDEKSSDKKISLFFSPFILLDKTFLLNKTALEKKKLFTDEKTMREWIRNSFNAKKELYPWAETLKKEIPKGNLKLIVDLFLNQTTTLALDDKEYKIVSSNMIDNTLIRLSAKFDNILRLFCDYNVKMRVNETNANEIITLDIKLLLDNSVLTVSGKKKNAKTKKDFKPMLVNKEMAGEDKIFFLPYLQLPPVADLEKLNENYMRLFTVPTEFYKLVHYLNKKDKFKKKFDLKEMADRQKVDLIVKKNMETMLDIFLPENSELFLERETVNDYKSPSKKEHKFYIAKRTIESYTPTQTTATGLPKKYTMTVEIQLSETKLTMFDFYKLGCKEKTPKIDAKLTDLMKSAFATEAADIKPSKFFKELMEPDVPEDTMNRMRPALLSSAFSGGRRQRTMTHLKRRKNTYKNTNKNTNKNTYKKRKTKKNKKN